VYGKSNVTQINRDTGSTGLRLRRFAASSTPPPEQTKTNLPLSKLRNGLFLELLLHEYRGPIDSLVFTPSSYQVNPFYPDESHLRKHTRLFYRCLRQCSPTSAGAPAPNQTLTRQPKHKKHQRLIRMPQRRPHPHNHPPSHHN
jgi:hypothetical protein